ncbi:glycosyltransferase family 2 protein [Paenibacillus sp. 481]|uniref:glycosyltransferase family 2 protein n=1 Tax=Paenibacillus sp. 481 TaxID=2835869 RepID=UPI001E2945C3|nr:glycosyltransferase family 2 protein [Paenibacillus sp. 481]UHA72581.1 glycosyltransferase family 2 protein [Paenibacillus sp. 481]
MALPRVLIGSPIKQQPDILQAFLQSLELIKQTSFEADFIFVDDNDHVTSAHDLVAFQNRNPKWNINVWPSEQPNLTYHRTETTHYWSEALIWHVAAMKDRILDHAQEMRYDYVFLIDSDVIIHPDTIERLMGTQKDIVANIYWTAWEPNIIEMPQVWLQDVYSLIPKARLEQLTDEESNARLLTFLKQLRQPGIFEVGGLGACTLISRKAIEAGVRFKEIRNISFWGEDRHFCVRAAALGFSLYVDTRRPAYHIYRQTDLDGVARYIQACKQPD